MMAVVTLAVSGLGATVFTVSKLRAVEHQLGVVAAEQGSCVLAGYDREIFQRFGIQSYQGSFPDRLGMAIQLSSIPGETIPDLQPGERLTEGSSLEDQIDDFMSVRFIKAGLEGLSELLGSMKTGQRSPLTKSLKDPGTQSSAKLLGALMKTDKEVSTGLLPSGEEEDGDGQESSDGEETEVSGENWSEEDKSLTNDVMHFLKDAARTELAFHGEGPDGQSKNVFDLDFLTEAINKVSEFIDGRNIPVLSDLALNEYGVRMFRSPVSETKAGKTNLYARSLRERLLADEQHEKEGELEYLIFGSESDQTNQWLASMTVFGARLLIRLGDYYMSPTKRAQTKTIAIIASVLIALASQGGLSIDPETLANIIMVVECGIGAYKDTKDLMDGKANKLLNYQRFDSPSFYYHDYARIFLLFTTLDGKLQRMAAVMEELSGEKLYTGITVRLDWQAPAPVSLSRQIKVEQKYRREGSGDGESTDQGEAQTE